MKKHKKIVMIVCFIGLLFLLIGVTYSFFNYTRIGQANSFRVGRINFSTTQNGSISLTNVFPITSDELDDDVKNHDSVSISITGDTTYAKGIEYLVSFVEVNNVINNRRIPVSYTVNSTNLGIPSGNYYDDRGSTTSVYFHNDGVIKENKYILVGYIASGETGINGSVTITAYVDANQIAITDTLVEDGPNYQYNGQATAQDISICANYIESLGYTMDQGSTYESFCQGMGTSYNSTIINYIENQWFYLEEIEYLMEHNIIIDTADYTKRTTKEWVNGRTVFTTDEWSSLKGNNALSFKIKVEANEGVWVDEESTPETCFTFSDPKPMYAINENITEEKIDACVDFLSNLKGAEEVGVTLNSGESYRDFCAGTGTIWGSSIEYMFSDTYSKNIIDGLIEIGLVDLNGYDTTILDYDINCGIDVVIPKKVNNSISRYMYNSNMTSQEINNCVSFLNQYWGPESIVEDAQNNIWATIREGESYQNFCGGTGTVYGMTFQNYLDTYYFQNDISTLIEYNIVTENIQPVVTMVTAISESGEDDNGAFENKGLKSVVIPNTIKYINNSSFMSNQLTSVTIPNSVIRIESYSFYGNHLTDIVIPNSVTTIGSGAFKNNLLTGVSIGNSVDLIGQEAFKGNRLTNVIIPDNVRYVMSGAYFDNPISDITIGSQVVLHNEYRPFYELDLSSLTINVQNIPGNILRSLGINSISTLVLGNSVKSVDHNAFLSAGIKNLTIGSNVERIQNSSFANNQIENVTFPNSVVLIGYSSFSGNHLKNVTIGNGIEEIWENAFLKEYSNDGSLNINLTSITIDKSCSYIKSMSSYPWIGSDYRAGTTIYGSNNEICDSW